MNLPKVMPISLQPDDVATQGLQSFRLRQQVCRPTNGSFTAYSYNYSGADWHARSLDLSGLTAGTYTLTYGPGTTATYLDNVVLDLKPTGSVPEAGSTAGLLCLGFGGMVALARRRVVPA